MRFEAAELYTGPEYEFDLVNQVNAGHPNCQKTLKAEQEKAIINHPGWQPRQLNSLPFREAVEFTKKFQPFDPANPTSDFAREFRLAMAENLGLEEDSDLEKLKLFTAVQSPLDAHHIDFFVTYAPKQSEEYFIGLDITKQPKKDEPLKGADMLIGGDIPDPSDDNFSEENYLKIINDYARQAVGILKDKVARGTIIPARETIFRPQPRP